MQNIDSLIDIIINSANEVYSILGSGHQEYIYHRALLVELSSKYICYDTEYNIQINYKGSNLGTKRVDIVIYDNFTENKQIVLILELKSIIKEPSKQEIQQIKHYISNINSKYKVNGIIINFPQPPLNSSKDIPDKIQSIII